MERDAGCRAVDLRCRVKREHLGSLGTRCVAGGTWLVAKGVGLGLSPRGMGWERVLGILSPCSRGERGWDPWSCDDTGDAPEQRAG